MTRYTEEQQKQLSDQVKGKKISELYHVPDGDYYVIEFEGGGEISLRFMTDLQQSKAG